MKAISIKPPWTELIASGRKALEIRSWPTDYRGPLLIVASAQPDREALPRFGMFGLTYGAAICIVELVDVRPFKRADEGRACCGWRRDRLAWQFARPRRVEPIKIKGRLRLYDVDDALIKVLT